MSTEWGYFCKDCQVESETWFNHGEEQLEQYYEVHHLLKDKDFQWIEITPVAGKWAAGEMEEFFEEHEGCDICLVNEYGKKQELPYNKRMDAT